MGRKNQQVRPGEDLEKKMDKSGVCYIRKGPGEADFLLFSTDYQKMGEGGLFLVLKTLRAYKTVADQHRYQEWSRCRRY